MYTRIEQLGSYKSRALRDLLSKSLSKNGESEARRADDERSLMNDLEKIDEQLRIRSSTP